MTYHSARSLPTPFAALAAACRRAFDDDAPPLPRVAAESCFLALARRHRVQGIAWRGLKRAGADLDLYPQLGNDARQIAHDNLIAADTALDLKNRFARAGVPILFVKGLALSQLAYGDAFVKMSADVDVLIDPEMVADAGHILREADYRCILPTRSSMPRWHDVHKESLWAREGRPLVELHTRLSDHPDLLPSISAAGPSQWVPIAPGLDLPTIPQDALPAYLAVHGASSLWFRLKWLADFAAIVRTISGRPSQAGAGLTLEPALWLSNLVFGTPVFGSRPGTLSSLARTQMLADREPTRRPLGTLPIHLGQMLMGGTAGFGATDAVRQVRSMLLRS